MSRPISRLPPPHLAIEIDRDAAYRLGLSAGP